MKSEGDDDTWFSGQNQENHRECLGSCKLSLPAAGEKKDAWLQVVGSKDEVGGGEPPQLHGVVPSSSLSGLCDAGLTPTMIDVPMAAADVRYVGADRNLNGIPDALEGGGASFVSPGTVPMAAADVRYVGVDYNRNGIPDALERGGASPVSPGTVPMAAANVQYVGVDYNRNGIPDALEGGGASPVSPGTVPMAAANVQYVGVDYNR